MTTEQLDNVVNACPFKPFTLHLADGSKHYVGHPEVVWRTQGGGTVFVNPIGEEVAIIDLLLVTKITHGNGVKRRRRESEE
jgi:hypothetical protein